MKNIQPRKKWSDTPRMNIFFLDRDPVKAAEYNCNKHCIKIILEAGECLRIAHGKPSGWKNHEIVKWVRKTRQNYLWTAHHALALCKEYSYRYDNKVHAWEEDVLALTQIVPASIMKENFTAPPQCMPAEYRLNDFVAGYRNYYLQGKRHLAKWTRREQPFWWR